MENLQEEMMINIKSSTCEEEEFTNKKAEGLMAQHGKTPSELNPLKSQPSTCVF